METLERSRVCRLCGKHAGTAIDIFDKRGNHVKKINSVLPILVHEMDLLPKHICHPCDYKLQEFHKFYEDCLRTDASLKGQLSWMRGPVARGDVGVPMVQISNFMIKTEPPDYDDGDTAEAVFRAESLASCEDACALYPKRIFASAGAKCARCGSRGAKSPGDERRARNAGKSRGVRHNLGQCCVEKSNNNNDGSEEFASRDSIRRNLFATEIFGDENPRIATEIPVCNVRGATTTTRSDEIVGSSARLERLECRQDGGGAATSHEMAAGRALRPRKTRIPRATSAPETTTKAEIVRSVAIKREASEELERSLRPRIGAIDYSDTRRKNPLAKNAARVNFAAVKIEPEAFLENVNPKNPRNVVGKKAKMSFAEFPKSSKIAGRKNVDELKSVKNEPRAFLENASSENSREIARSTADFSKISSDKKIAGWKNFDEAKSAEALKAKSSNRRRSPTRDALKAAPYLRSQRVHLRSGKLREFESVAEKPKRIQLAKRGILLKAIKREDARSKRAIFKHRDCGICCSRFASAELYMLHNCYANRRR